MTTENRPLRDWLLISVRDAVGAGLGGCLKNPSCYEGLGSWAFRARDVREDISRW
jgi:hypothetical protein